ncbi:sugar ABC transporter substrate-binding protein [Jiella sp. MQZ9-1]|uniref:Sugar ABC transporter substrate-binding protein n=1 Tax=Jiella flava TaxID=2816857 RepID=A0A939FX35_9HYPH|nr:sugar ABC transporter substrate-binding protein [Jiella flava]MBO0660974.1 sugar ABC transporter substrate-binding protein [Jiella flava]MCD2469622.1 sugar ABC transporter substrate-binding protein [Jiella flava]
MNWFKTALLASAVVMSTSAVQAKQLTIWGLQAFNKQADALIGDMAKDFGKQHGVDVQYVVVPANVLTERLAAAFEGNSAPDVFMQLGQNSQYYAESGLIQPLDGVLTKLRAAEGGIYESLVPQAMYKGHPYSVPIEVDVVPMYARKDLLKEVGKDVPKTWEELREAAKAIVKQHPQYIGLGVPLSNANDAETDLRMLVWSFGGAMFSKDGSAITWNSPDTVAAYTFIKDMVDEGTIPRSVLTWDDGGNNTAYQTGRAAFIMNPPSVYSWMEENDKDLLSNTALINIPRGPGKDGLGATLLGSFSWLVSKKSDQADLAKQWLEYFYQPDHYKKLIEVTGGRWVPIFPQMTKTMPLFANNPAYANFDALARNGLTIGYKGAPTPLASQVYTSKILSNSVQRMLVDGDSPKDAVAWAQKQIEDLKAKQK